MAAVDTGPRLEQLHDRGAFAVHQAVHGTATAGQVREPARA
jgi:hypothetical protein